MWRSENVPRFAVLVTIIAFAASMLFGIVRTEAHVRSVALAPIKTDVALSRGAPAARGGEASAVSVPEVPRTAHRSASYAAAVPEDVRPSRALPDDRPGSGP